MLAASTTVNVFLTAMGCLGEYALILLLTDGNFGTQTIGMYMFQQAFGQQSARLRLDAGHGAVRHDAGDRQRVLFGCAAGRWRCER